MSMKKFFAFGLTIESDLVVGQLATASPDSEVDLTIRIQSVPSEGLEAPLWRRRLTQVSSDALWLEVPNVGRFLATGGTAISVDPAPGADDADLRTFVFGSCIGAILHQRGYLVLHASATKVAGGLVGICGDSGAGKSTTAALLANMGGQPFTDDVLAIDRDGNAWPGPPISRLWASSMSALGLNSSEHAPIRRGMLKYELAVPEPWDAAVPLRPEALVILEPDHYVSTTDYTIETIVGMHKFEAIQEHTYRRDAIAAMGNAAQHLLRASKLAEQAHFVRLRRPTARFCGDEVSAAIWHMMEQRIESSEAAVR